MKQSIDHQPSKASHTNQRPEQQSPVSIREGEFSLIALQRLVGNQAVQRLLIQRRITETTNPQDQAAIDAENGPLPTADMGERRGGRAYAIDWDSHHREIDGLRADETLRDSFERNFVMQVERFFVDDLPCYDGYQATLDAVHNLIEQKRSRLETAEAERLTTLLRHAEQFAVVETLNVEDSARHQPVTGGATYCNIYTYDVVTALGGYLPRVWWNDAAIRRIRAGEHVAVEYGTTVHEMNANAINAWLDQYGGDYGWRRLDDMTEGQQQANAGELVIISAANQSASSSGHINVLMPETEGNSAARDAEGNVERPMQSQAGRNNFEYQTSGGEWWQDSSHRNGAAWVFRGERHSDLLTPEQANEPEGTDAPPTGTH